MYPGGPLPMGTQQQIYRFFETMFDGISHTIQSTVWSSKQNITTKIVELQLPFTLKNIVQCCFSNPRVIAFKPLTNRTRETILLTKIIGRNGGNNSV